MGNMLFDFILHPAFVVFVLIALFTAVVALVIAHRQKQLSAGVSAGSAQPIWVGKKHPI